MALQILPQMQFGQPRSWSGGGGSRTRSSADAGIDRAIKLENLNRLKSEHKDRDLRDEARAEARAGATTVEEQEGYTLNLSTGESIPATTKTEKVDPEKAADLYGFELAERASDLALVYNQNLTAHKQAKHNLELDAQFASKERLQKLETGDLANREKKLTVEQLEKVQPLKMQMIQDDATIRGLDMFVATKGTDQEGAKKLINMYVDKEKDQVASLKLLPNGDVLVKQNDGDVINWNATMRQFVNVDREQKLKSWIDLLELDQRKKEANEKKDKDRAKTVPRDATMNERNDAARWLENDPLGQSVSSEQRKLMGAELAQNIIDIQTEQKDRGIVPDDQEVARSKAVNKMARRTLPSVKTTWYDLKLDKPARYFTSKEAVESARKNGDITEEEKDYLLKGFDDSPKETTKESKSDSVKVKNKDGVVGTIPRSQLDAAKKEGYIEVK